MLFNPARPFTFFLCDLFFSLSAITADSYNTVCVREKDRGVCVFGPGWVAEIFRRGSELFYHCVCVIY
ncbi:hypothetical protein OIU77_026592, partial [Salix suchowensis]